MFKFMKSDGLAGLLTPIEVGRTRLLRHLRALFNERGIVVSEERSPEVRKRFAKERALKAADLGALVRAAQQHIDPADHREQRQWVDSVLTKSKLSIGRAYEVLEVHQKEGEPYPCKHFLLKLGCVAQLPTETITKLSGASEEAVKFEVASMTGS